MMVIMDHNNYKYLVLAQILVSGYVGQTQAEDVWEQCAEEGTWAKKVASNVGSRKLHNEEVCGYTFKQILGRVGGTCNTVFTQENQNEREY